MANGIKTLKAVKKIREVTPADLKEVNILESLEKMSRRPESRIDVQSMLETLTPNCKTYVRHLVTSGPTNIALAAKACDLTEADVQACIVELAGRIQILRS
jgi:inosine-uridine nucleoside N-ribohydrolase